MDYVTRHKIISHKVLNENTGELESKNFTEEKRLKKIRGGFNMIYHKNYEDVMVEVINSNKELRLFNWITNQFTYDKKEASISYPGKDFISKPQYLKMIKKLIEIGYLYKVKRGTYMLNPYIFLPYRADAEKLQKEWSELMSTKGTNDEK